SNGKTIIKEWLYQLLYHQVNVLRSPRSFNSQIGVPLSVWELNETHELGVFEAGISTTAEMAHLEAVIQPTIGIFGNIGQAHQAGFRDMRQKVLEKLKLFNNCQTLIYCKDYGLIEEAVQSQLQEGFFDNDDLTLYSWSKQGNADLEIGSVHQDQGITHIKGFWKEEQQEIAIPFTDPASIENAIHCWLTLLVMGYEGAMIQEGMEALSPVRMRMEMKNGVNGCTLINDSYNSDLLSIDNALDFLNQQSQHSKRTVILSDILQAGMSEKELYHEVARVLESKAIDRLIGIGPAINRNHEFFNTNEFFNSTEDFLNGYGPNDFQNEAILIKGARKFHFEDISKLLQQKAHQTLLEINLEAMIHNLNVYRSYLKPGTKVMVMVKAFAYGSGSYEIANILQFHKADYLAVAYADEGIHLREAGIQLPIMVMNPEEESFERIVAYKLEPEVYSIRQLEQFAKATASTQANEIPVHIKLDTGMHRLGFTEDELPALLSTLEKASQIKIKSAFSHLVASDEPQEDDFTQKQIDAFERMVDTLQNYLEEDFLKHILNTGGIVRHSKAQYDMVRLGLGIYGIDTTSHVAAPLRTVSTLKTTVAQLKHLKPGDTVGYGRAGKITKTTTIATLSIGYADGY
ncbi:MAG: bifunctional UDP-N-acetylmuramoyl-tripeptide:D-alanyl-D-alanine ligase/alanine racemase, partial [Bacteroidetes bacterium SW_10_40_5]